LDETLPIFTDLLALEIVERKDKQAVLKHPNTEWCLVVHEGGPGAANKPHNNHYGFRVANHREIEAAYEYISDHKAKYKIKTVTKPHEAHFAYSIYFKEPGGNDLEIEYYNPQAVKQGRKIAAPQWTVPLTEEKFPGRGYVPQAMTHGTLNCDDKATSDRFLEGVLGLKIVGGGRSSTYIAHPDTPWYIVVLPTTHRDYLSPASRFTLKLASTVGVVDAYREFSSNGKDIGVMHYWDLEEENGRKFFIFSDINRNWWEVTS
jgi:catechol 2,3-dioxygenase-like lactoylglutathione lyase family enzyme